MGRGAAASGQGGRRCLPAGAAPGRRLGFCYHRRPVRVADFHYDLPESLIARRPLAERRASRLLILDGASGACRDARFSDLGQLLRAGDLLVVNDTRVVPARLAAAKAGGARVEILVERPLEGQRFLAWIRANRSPRRGSLLRLADGTALRVLGRREELYELELPEGVSLEALLARHGEVPIPPYLRRPAEALDCERYQTVYARAPGSVAAPTAGLHFDEALLADLEAGGVAIARLTLHVGAGTFAPLRGDEVEGQRLHAEQVSVPEAVCDAVERTRAAGGRVVAVGTTTVRALESAAGEEGMRPFEGETRLFIVPGFRFRCVDALVTNFHLPGSSLLMLVCAFAGREPVLAAYRHAVARAYRFFSYGDAMFVTRAPG
jgi:S-adenosylmethionine:tRNA ribosyltransferase-isomerase